LTLQTTMRSDFRPSTLALEDLPGFRNLAN
jgi:hypothetical protein